MFQAVRFGGSPITLVHDIKISRVFQLTTCALKRTGENWLRCADPGGPVKKLVYEDKMSNYMMKREVAVVRRLIPEPERKGKIKQNTNARIKKPTKRSWDDVGPGMGTCRSSGRMLRSSECEKVQWANDSKGPPFPPRRMSTT